MARVKEASIIVAGVMSGTSADGVNVALLRLGSAAGRAAHGAGLRFELLGHEEFAYPRAVRRAILAAMNASAASVAELARLHVLLGDLYSDAVISTQEKFRVQPQLIGCHGQTLYHQGERARYLGRAISTTWQAGEAAVIAARVGVPVVSDFRPADMAAGGKGAPLVPFLDYLLFRDSQSGRIVQNIGGIANLTAIPAAARPEDVIAFDTGPGNMVIDAVTERLFGQPYDRGGRIAAGGVPNEAVLKKLLQARFFRKSPPKTAGREEFGREFAGQFLRVAKASRKQDIVATATALTAQSIADAAARHVIGRYPKKAGFRELIVSGGGARNLTLMTMLRNALAPMGLALRTADDFGLPSEAKEAAAFAVMAYETWHRRPSNIPSATGAQRAAVLGKISYP